MPFEKFIHDYFLSSFSWIPLTGDASHRRYSRIFQGEKSFIAVDASDEKSANAQFVKIAQAFLLESLNVPLILKADLDQGFLLLSDLGQSHYLDVLNQADELLCDQLYRAALSALVPLKNCRLTLPFFDEALLHREMSLFKDWFLQQHLKLALTSHEQKILNTLFAALIKNALAQPQVCVHRDYHSRNLMVTPSKSPGILDFQDAVIGPLMYDPVSLLKDCYIKWPDSKIEKWLRDYYSLLKLNEKVCFEECKKWFDLMGLQRHLKAIGIFARLMHRDKKNGYLKDIPRTLSYITDLSDDYAELTEFQSFLEARVLESEVLCHQP